MTERLAESGTLTKSGGRWLIQAISPGKGSSGVYPQETLEAAAKDRVFPAGTMLMVDHATEAEDWSRPEGSIKDLAGVLTEDARWDDQYGALVAEAKIFEHWRPTLESLKDDIGLSIRASGEVEESADGRIIKRLVEGRSIDFVTKAGRGGRVLSVLESARPSTLTEIAELFRPPEPPGPSGMETQESNQRKDANMGTIQISEADHKALTDKAGRVEQLEADLAESNRKLEEAEGKPFPPKGGSGGEGGSELDRLRKENAALKAEIAELKKAKAKEARRNEVTGIVEEAFEHINAPGMKNRLIDQLTESDKNADTIATEAKEAADELRTLGAGDGQVRGLGESRPADTTQTNVNESELPSWEELATMKGA